MMRAPAALSSARNVHVSASATAFDAAYAPAIGKVARARNETMLMTAPDECRRALEAARNSSRYSRQ